MLPGLDLQSVYMNKWWMMMKVISNYLICVQCSAGFAVFTYKDTRCEDKYRIQNKMKTMYTWTCLHLQISALYAG